MQRKDLIKNLFFYPDVFESQKTFYLENLNIKFEKLFRPEKVKRLGTFCLHYVQDAKFNVFAGWLIGSVHPCPSDFYNWLKEPCKQEVFRFVRSFF